MDKTFQPSEIETKWYQLWEEKGYFSPSGTGDPYCIMIPPPNVTGSLHMGHGFQESILDLLIRYHRMKGNNTLWQVGTDHAGIATQMVVERQLEAQGLTRQELGRDKFIEKVWEWKEQSGGTITQQLRRMGSSIDWTRERFTMDEGLSNAVKEVFVQLFDEGLIYRGNRLVNWDPVLLTAVSDLEVSSEEEDGFLWHFVYPLSDGSGSLTVATTRPETMLGDTAIAVNPTDPRFQHLIGKTVLLPLANREIPIIADDYVDAEFGSGCVKITPAHDFNDYEVGKRHDLAMINILNDDATLNNNCPTAYQGLDRFEARKKIIADLDALGLLNKIDNHKLKVPRGERSNTIIEPYLTEQWYVDAKTLAKPAIAAVENGDIVFVPKQYENIYFSWMRDIQDWCISRQLWWGHRIPAWYDNEDNVFVGRNEIEVRAKYQLGDRPLRQDNDVLDTWFSSALWTFSTLGWPEQTKELETFHPTNVLVTGFDIIFFWVARMIMMTLHIKKEVPFKQVYVHGLVRDAEGQKMSKSKGNVLDPIDLIDGIDLEQLVQKRTSGMMQPKRAQKVEKSTRKQFPTGIAAYGTDALRFTYYSLASTGRDIKFDMGRIEGYHFFCNKIWNAARYVLMNTQEHDCGFNNPSSIEFSLADRWITSRLEQTTQNITKALEDYRFDLASQTLYDFIWNEYCGWYLELSKPMLVTDEFNSALKMGTRYTLVTVLEATLRLLHPFMPFITEEIWQRVAPLLGHQHKSIMLQAYPSTDPQRIDNQALNDIEWVQNVIIGVRNIRGEINISPAKMMTLLLKNGNDEDLRRLQQNKQFLMTLAKLDNIEWLNADQSTPMSATALVGNMELFVPMEGLIDKDAEVARLNKEIDKLQKEVAKLKNKLSNSSFVNNAPAAVVQQEQEKLRTTQQAWEKLSDNLASIEAL